MLKPWILMTLSALSCTTMLSAHTNHWTALGDFVFLRRAKVNHHSLVKDADKIPCHSACPDYTVIRDSTLVNHFDFEPGYRVALTYMPNTNNSLEAIFLYLLQPWEGKKTALGDQSLYFFSDQDYDLDFTNADRAVAKYSSAFWDAEFNYWRNLTPRNVNYFAASVIAGLRYFNLNERFSLKMITPPDESSYNIHTQNRMGGAQVGFDVQWNPMRWFGWEFFAKAGWMANYTEQNQFLGDDNNQTKVRDSNSRKWGNGVFTDVSAQLAFNIKNHFNVHAGYQFLYISGLALAPGQISKKTGSNAGKRDHVNGAAMIHGLFAGIAFTF